MFYPQFVYLYILNGENRDSVPLSFLQHDNCAFFVYIHFQFGDSALSIARLKCIPEIEKLLVKYGAKEVSLYLFDNICNIYIFTKNQVQPIICMCGFIL